MTTSDGDRLLTLLGQRNKAAFARAAGIPGGPSMVSQHISGNRPISLEAAVAYARGLQVKIDAISPAAAALLRQALPLLDESGDASSAAPAPALGQALEVLGIELARDMPDDVRDDVADALHKLARRKGAERDQLQVLHLLKAPPTKQPATA